MMSLQDASGISAVEVFHPTRMADECWSNDLIPPGNSL